MITTRGELISPRFDMSSEVVVAMCYDRKLLEEPRSILLSDVSGELICDLALKENVSTVICCGIEGQHYQFLTWKNIQVIDSVIGTYTEILKLALNETLKPGTILPRPVRI